MYQAIPSTAAVSGFEHKVEEMERSSFDTEARLESQYLHVAFLKPEAHHISYFAL